MFEFPLAQRSSVSISEPIRIRPAALGDLHVIRHIYNYYVLTSTCTFQLEPIPRPSGSRGSASMGNGIR